MGGVPEGQQTVSRIGSGSLGMLPGSERHIGITLFFGSSVVRYLAWICSEHSTAVDLLDRPRGEVRCGTSASHPSVPPVLVRTPPCTIPLLVTYSSCRISSSRQIDEI